MKKLFLIALICFFLLSLSAGASMVVLDYQGETVVFPNSIERNLIINSNDGGSYDIAMRPLDECLRSSDGSVEIPLDKVYINNTREDVYFRYNEYSNVFKALEMGGVAKNLTAKVRDYGMVPAGVYNLNFEIQATDVETGTIASMSTFNLRFIVPIVQEINLNAETPKINVGASDVFNKNKRIINESSPMIRINSNCDWELVLNTDNFEQDAGNYYIRTLSASSNVTERLQEKVLLTPGKEIVIARGKAPSNNEYIYVEYSLENKDGKVLRSGNYTNSLRYVLRSR